MTTLFPGAYDDFLNPTSGTQLSATGYKHHQHHTDLNDAVEAIEHVIGTPGVSSGVVYGLVSLSGAVTTLSGQMSSGVTTVSGLTTTVSGLAVTVSGAVTTLSGLVVTVSGTAAGAAISGSFLTVTTLSGTAARVFTLGASLSGTDAGSGSTYTTRVYPTGVTSGSYYKPAVIVNAQGQITFAGDSGLGDGLVRGAPEQPRFVSNFWFGDYVSTYDKVYFNTKVATGSLYYIDRTDDLPVLIGSISGKTPGVMLYSTILTGFIMSNSTTSGFICTITGGSVVGTTIGMDGGACIRSTVSGKTIYANAIGNSRVEVYDPATTTVTNTVATSPGGTHGRSIVFVSGSDSVYSIRRSDGDILKIYCPTTGTATISGIGNGLSSSCSLTYNANANRVIGCGGNNTMKIVYFTPLASSGTETASTLAFPSSWSSDGAYVAYSMGNYVYFSNTSGSPSLGYVLDAVNMAWVRPLGFSDNAASTTSLDRGSFMAGIAAEGVLYFGASYSASIGYVTYGRY